MPSNNRIAWKRVFVEGLTILVSILLAFSIDAWWANRNDRAEERRLLISLREELATNVESFQSGVVFRTAVGEAAFEILEIAEGAKPIPSSSEVDQLIGSLNWWNSSSPSIGVLKTVAQSGKLSLITDESLRAEIASIESTYESLRAVESQAYDTFKQAWMPYLYSHGHIAQVSNAQRSAPGSGLGEQPVLPALNPIDHSSLFSDREFSGIVTNIYWDQTDAQLWLEIAVDLLSGIISDIDTHLE